MGGEKEEFVKGSSESTSLRSARRIKEALVTCQCAVVYSKANPRPTCLTSSSSPS